MKNIEKKVVVITGASSGLGRATALHLAKRGAYLVLSARRNDLLQNLVEQIVAEGGEAIAVQADVTKKEAVQQIVDTAIRVFGRIDVMINNAGVMSVAPLNLARIDEWDRMIDINIKGLLYGIGAALPVFEKQQSGHFINIASVAGLKVFSPGGTVYSGTKFAVKAITEGLRHEAGPHIRTTTISPGAIDSELKLGSSHEESARAVSEFYQQAIPAESVARAIAFAIEQPMDVDINEIVLRPTSQDF